MHSYHGIGKCCRNSDCHPPCYISEKLLALSSHQAADQFAIQLCDIKAKQRANHQEYAMTDDQPQLLTLPARYDNFQQPPQSPKKLAIKLDPLSHSCFSLAWCGSWALAGLGLVERSRFLLGDRITNAINQSNGKSEVDSSGYLVTMLQIEFRQRGNHSFEGLV